MRIPSTTAVFFVTVLISFVCFFSFTAVAEDLKTPSSQTKATIRKIQIEIRDVFDEPDAGFFYRAVNSVKISTREKVVRRELLFREGDVFDEFRVAESERSLRALPYLRKISITPIRDGEFVDVIVSVQDTWTLLPFISFSTGAGVNKQSIGLAETNVFGYGKRMEVLYAEDEGRQKVEGVYDDTRLFDTYQHLTLGVFDRSDGYRTVGFYGRPFRSLVEPYAWNVDTDFYDLVGKIFKNGDEHFLYRERHESVSAGFTFAQGDPTVRVHRYTLGYDYSTSDFKEATDQDFDDVNVDPRLTTRDPALLAEDRKFSGPFVALQSIVPDFVSLNFVDRFERVEDYNLGNDLYGRVTLAGEALGSSEDTLLLNLSDSDGMKLSPTSFVRGKLSAVTRTTFDSFENSIFSGDFRYYNVQGAKYLGSTYIGKYTLVGSLTINFADRLDKNKQFLLGASNGLRGYRDRSFAGSQELLLNLEQRVHFVEDLFHLISIGGAVFADGGGMSNEGLGDIINDEFRADVGFGFRLGFPRSSGGSVLRIDIAFPTRDGPDGSSAWQPRLLISTAPVVTARLPQESQQTPGSNVTVKFIP